MLEFVMQKITKIFTNIKAHTLSGLLWMKWWKIRTSQYLLRVGIAISVLVNVILGGAANQTFSARNYGWKRSGRWNICWLIDFLIRRDVDHCLHSWLYWYTGKNIRKSGKRYLQQYQNEVQSLVYKGEYDENFD